VDIFLQLFYDSINRKGCGDTAVVKVWKKSGRKTKGTSFLSLLSGFTGLKPKQQPAPSQGFLPCSILNSVFG